MKKILLILLFAISLNGFSQNIAVLRAIEISRQQKAPANLYTLANAANPDNEVDATTGVVVTANWTATSVSSLPTPQNGTYCLVWTHGGPDNTLYNSGITLSGIEIGETYEVTFYVNRYVGGNFTVGLNSTYGWGVSDLVTVNSTFAPTLNVWHEVIVSATATSTTPRLSISSNSNADTGNKLAVDNIVIRKL